MIPKDRKVYVIIIFYIYENCSTKIDNKSPLTFDQADLEPCRVTGSSLIMQKNYTFYALSGSMYEIIPKNLEYLKELNCAHAFPTTTDSTVVN